MRSITLVKVRTRLPERPGEGLPAFSLLEVTIKTGRTHQIRVHLASQGHTIAGTKSTVTSTSTAACTVTASNACSCMPGGCSSTTLPAARAP